MSSIVVPIVQRINAVGSWGACYGQFTRSFFMPRNSNLRMHHGLGMIHLLFFSMNKFNLRIFY